MYDEIGQLRASSAIVPNARVLNSAADSLTAESASAVKAEAWVQQSSSVTQWQITPYVNASTVVLHGLLLSSGGGSAKCPADHRFIYGSDAAGWHLLH